MPLIALLTDFGLTDTYVGQMHGILAGLAPEARVIDLSHAVPPQDVAAGAAWLEDVLPTLSAGTIVVAVVDPGVGSTRRAIAAELGSWTFVGPDNGLLTGVLRRWPLIRAVELTNPQYHRTERSTTFHGRDIFCPAAAHIARGVAFESLGPILSTPLVTLPDLEPFHDGARIVGRVLWIDHFGNAITTIRRATVEATFGTTPPTVDVGPHQGLALVGCYADAPDHRPVALWGSRDRLEIALKNGDAARVLNLTAGTPVIYHSASPPV
jgi:hypothetical protein